MINDCPVFVDERKESIHEVGDFIEVRRCVFADVNRFFAISPTELGDVSHCCIVQRPQ